MKMKLMNEKIAKEGFELKFNVAAVCFEKAYGIGNNMIIPVKPELINDLQSFGYRSGAFIVNTTEVDNELEPIFCLIRNGREFDDDGVVFFNVEMDNQAFMSFQWALTA